MQAHGDDRVEDIDDSSSEEGGPALSTKAKRLRKTGNRGEPSSGVSAGGAEQVLNKVPRLGESSSVVSAGGAEEVLNKAPRRGVSSSVGGAVLSNREPPSDMTAASTAWVADHVQSTPLRAVVRDKTITRSRYSFGLLTPAVRTDDLYAETPIHAGKSLLHIINMFLTFNKHVC